MNLYLYCIAHPVTALGPGRRVALWVSGCSLACKGCITPELWDRSAGQSVTVERVQQRLLALESDIDGITLTGGEPFEQPAALAELLTELAAERPHWNVLAFSGYPLRSLQKKGRDARRLLDRLDLLVAGPYVAKRAGKRSLIASDNQVLHCLSGRGRALRPAFEAQQANMANLAVGPDGEKMLIGVIQPEARQGIHQDLGIQSQNSGGTT